MASTLQNLLRQTAEKEKEKADTEQQKLAIVPPVENTQNKGASKSEAKPLAGQNNSASLLAKAPELLAGSPTKGASKLADENKGASRTDAQRLADMRKSRGTRTQIAIRIGTQVKRDIDAFVSKHEITQQDFFELAASSFISKVLAELEDVTASKLAPEDRRNDLLFKTDSRIVNLFREYNKILNPETTWKAKDDAVGFRYNSIDLRMVEMGIIYTQSNYITLQLTDPPKAFKYYTNEIDKFAAQNFPANIMELMLESGRKNWRILTGRELDLSFLEK